MRDAKEDRVSLAGVDPEEALRALLKVDPESEPVDEQPCPKTWNGKRCKLQAGHFGPCQYDA
jgi:hypothetical protein